MATRKTTQAPPEEPVSEPASEPIERRPFSVVGDVKNQWIPPQRTTRKSKHKDPELVAKMEAMTCSSLGCEKFKPGTAQHDCKLKKRVVWEKYIKGHWMGGLPQLYCGYCRNHWTPVDLGLMTAEEATKIAEDLYDGS